MKIGSFPLRNLFRKLTDEKLSKFRKVFTFLTDLSEATYVQGDPVLKYPVGPGRFVIIFRYFSFWKYARLQSIFLGYR